MKKFLLIIAVLVVVTSCKKENVEKEPKSFNVSQKQQQLINSGNEFGFDLFRKINQSEKNKNLFISPFSVSMALGMTLNGAESTTYDAMLNTMKFQGLSQTEINSTYKYLIDNLKPLDPNVNFTVANSIWYRMGYTVFADFINANRDYFYAQVTPLDFDKSDESKNIINDWVKDKTNGKITDIVDQINPDHFMFLINAIYFKGNWKYKFDKSDTKNMDFNLNDGGTVSVPFMYKKMDAKTMGNDLLSALELPYGEGNYSMVILVPEHNKTVDDIVSQLNPANWDSWLKSMYKAQGLDIYLPKFKFEYEITLNQVLSDLGMDIAFTDMADFSKITSDVQLYISKVKHKSYVDVNEDGTEAAAATSVDISFTSIQQFIANKPFLFIIRERNTNAVLFIGKVLKPVL